ncbi:MAG: ribonuclease HII [Magnetovibrionaceae bacterium]
MPDLSLEAACPQPVCGVDEVGRGPWAGPVVAAAVILPQGAERIEVIQALDDSKKLSAAKREQLYESLTSLPGLQWSLGEASVAEIDELNILQATFLAMKRAVEGLGLCPAFALIDGNKVPPGLPCEAEAVVKGDGRSLSIAAASVLAKVTRDRLMAELDRAHPGYGWAKNAGYGVKAHQAGLAELGVTEHHRRSFKPIAAILARTR